jgi:polyisoprenoid-binding protein YceI
MTTTWQIDPSHSSVNFSIKHMMIAKVHGGFEKFSGTLVYDDQNPSASTINASIESASISTREANRDTHLKSADFFDVEKFPAITFTATNIQRTGDGEFKALGNLTIRDVTQEVALIVEGPSEELKDPYGNIKTAFSATTKIKRKDFGLNWNAALETGGILVGEDVSITLDLQFAKQVAVPA